MLLGPVLVTDPAAPDARITPAPFSKLSAPMKPPSTLLPPPSTLPNAVEHRIEAEMAPAQPAGLKFATVRASDVANGDEFENQTLLEPARPAGVVLAALAVEAAEPGAPVTLPPANALAMTPLLKP